MAQGAVSAVGGMLLVTGANGFVGSALCRSLRQRGTTVLGAVRQGAVAGQVNVGNLNGSTDWRPALAGCDVVMHLAARVHVMSDNGGDQLAAYREVNLDATLQLARQAQAHGVRRFVFVSSVKVNGEATSGRAFGAHDLPMPLDPYGQSKLEAEQALRELGKATGMQIVIVRPPLVYGPGVKANFANLLRLVQLGIPLPFASVHNQRSIVALDNLVDLLITCARHPAAQGHTFMVSDGADLSIGELVALIGTAMGRRAMLLPMPVGLMLGAARLIGKAALVERLCGSLQVDIAATRHTLGWSPIIGSGAAIDATVAHFLAAQGKKTA